jgi:hypothetical protein
MKRALFSLPIFPAIFLILLAALLAQPVLAHDDHGKPQWGGVVADAGDFQAELVIKGGQAKIYLSLHTDMLPSQGASGKLTLLAGGKKEELVLQPVSDSALGAKTALASGKGAKAVAVIQLPGKAPATLRFAVK